MAYLPPGHLARRKATQIKVVATDTAIQHSGVQGKATLRERSDGHVDVTITFTANRVETREYLEGLGYRIAGHPFVSDRRAWNKLPPM